MVSTWPRGVLLQGHICLRCVKWVKKWVEKQGRVISHKKWSASCENTYNLRRNSKFTCVIYASLKSREGDVIRLPYWWDTGLGNSICWRARHKQTRLSITRRPSINRGNIRGRPVDLRENTSRTWMTQNCWGFPQCSAVNPLIKWVHLTSHS